MKASPFVEQILQLIVHFLRKAKHQDIANDLESKFQLPHWIEKNNPLLKKGLAKIIKQYVKDNAKLQNYYETRQPDHEQQQVDNSEPKRKRSTSEGKKVLSPKFQQEPQNKTKLKSKESPKNHPKVASPKPSSWLAKFQQPKRLQDIQSEKIISQTVQIVTKSKNNSKKVKKEKIQSSDYQSQQDSFELQPKKKLKKQVKAQKIETKKVQKMKAETKAKESTIKQSEELPQKEEAIIKKYIPTSSSNDGPKQSFTRINVKQVGPIKEQLKDNSFMAKGKYGQAADDWGQFGYEKLKDTRGDSFKKQKGKLKNRAFQGNLMDFNKINSIPIE